MSTFTFTYGVTFAKKDPRFLKVAGKIYFSLNTIVELYGSYFTFREQEPIQFAGYFTESFGILSFGWIIIIKREQIVSFIQLHYNLLSSFQYKMAILFSSVTLTSFVVEHIYSFICFHNNLIKFSSLNFTYDSYVFFQPAIFFAFEDWTVFGATIYCIMYFLMIIKHSRILDELERQKILSYEAIYKIFIQFKGDYEHFDNMVGLLPACWLVHIFLAMNAISKIYISSLEYKVQVVVFIFKYFLIWPVVYILVNIWHKKIRDKIKKIQLTVVLARKTDEPKGLLVQLLDQIANVTVTAGYLVKFDYKLFLPYIGSLCTYTFLFHDKFKQL